MEFNKPIADMLPGMDVEGFYILRAAALKTTNNGKPFLSGTICDRTGSVEIKLWDYSGPIGARPDDTGRVVKIRGSVSEYRGALQISVHRIRMAEAADDYDTALLVPTAPIDADAALADVQRLVASITDADYRSVAETMLARHLDAFRRIPAGKSVHHSFLSGLLMHTYNMLRTADFLAGDLHERREVCEADALAAVLVTCNLRDDLRGDVAGGGEAVRLFNERAGDDRAVLQHVFEVYEVAVVHVLREIVHIMEMDDALLMCFDDFARKQNAARDVFGDLAGHVIALDAVYGWIFIRVFLLDFLVVALDKAENLVIGGIGAARKRTRIAVTDILLSDIERTLPHDLLFYEVLYFFHGRCTPHGDARSFDICSDCANLLVRKSLTLVDLFICLGDSDDNLSDIERCFRAVSLNDLHVSYRSFIPPAGAACFQPLWFS